MFKVCALLVLISSFALPANAQSTSKKATARVANVESKSTVARAPKEEAWDKEPEAFLGIKFNEPFKVNPCPTKNIGQYTKIETFDYEAMKTLESVCLDTIDTSYKYQKTDNGVFKLGHLPSLGIGYSAQVHVKDGVVSKITIELKQPNFSILRTAFMDRYGQPTSVDNSPVKTLAGGEFSAADITWKGNNISIRMYERFNKVDESYVIISDNVMMEVEISAMRAKRAAEAQKF